MKTPDDLPFHNDADDLRLAGRSFWSKLDDCCYAFVEISAKVAVILWILFGIFFLGALITNAFADDDYRIETQRLNDSAAIHGTLNPRVYAAPVGQETSNLAIPFPSREPPIDYRLTEPEPQRFWDEREWKQ